MFQGDSLLGFAIGSALATAAGDGLKASQYRIQNKYFLFLMLHLSMVVRPFNLYMLWEHTGFETLFYLDASINGFWPALNCFANILFAIVGFLVARHLILLNKELAAYTLWTSSFSLLFGITTSHYDRLSYAGGIRDFYEGKTYQLKEYFQSKLFLTWALKFILTMAPIQYAQITWPREEGFLTKSRKNSIIRHCVKILCLQGVVLGLGVLILNSLSLTPADWKYDRVIAVVCGQVPVAIVLITPILLMSTKYVVTKKIDIRRSKPLNKPLRRKKVQRNYLNPQMRNGIHEDQWEESSEYSTQDQEEVTASMNGTANHLLQELPNHIDAEKEQ